MQSTLKIHIIGPVGSGKSTLARFLSNKLSVPHFQLDDMVWMRLDGNDRRRDEVARDTLLLAAIQKEAWIIEGAQHSWAANSFAAADYIILLDIPYKVRRRHINTRWLLQKLGKEKAGYTPTFKILQQLHGWNKSYQQKDRTRILSFLEQYTDKLHIVYKLGDNEHLLTEIFTKEDEEI